MSQDVFQMQMDQATDHLPGIIIIHDDIWVYIHTPEELEQHLLQLMQTAKEHSLVFNSVKCQIRQCQIALHSAAFTAQGRWQDPAKIQDLPTPNSQVKLQSFLGLINYLQLFIPHLSAKTKFLWEQLAKQDWNQSTDAGFQHLKAWIC